MVDHWWTGAPAGAAADLSGSSLALAVVAVAVVGWVLSLWLHPNRRCRRCRGTGKHFGSTFTSAFRLCTSCGGNGRQKRVGARLLRANR